MNKTELLESVIENNTEYHKLYRAMNPWSRATNDWTYYGSSGSVCRAKCIYCRNTVATCSGKWPRTKTFFREADAHTDECKKKWFSTLKAS